MIKRLTLLLVCTMCIGSLLMGQVKNPVQVANSHLAANLENLQLSASDIADYRISNQVVSKHNKLTHLYLQQQFQGIPIHNAILNINIKEDGKVLSLGNRFERDLAKRINKTSPQLSMGEAIVAFMEQFGIPNDGIPQVEKAISETAATFDPRGIALEPIQVALVFQPMSNRKIKLAWNITFYELNAMHWWNVRIDAETGAVLDYFDQVVHCEFEVPEDNCDSEFLVADDVDEDFEWTTSGDGASYRAYPLTIESPNHGDRILSIDPADPLASPLGWHDTNGEEGAEFTITRGNNAHAYHDIFSINESSNDEPDGGDTLCFDFDLDLAINRPYTQIDPLVTNLFYWNNLMHDVWFQYGFDEGSGNFQATNYSGEGIGNDYVRAEALDGSGTGNANFATPADGSRPRMQMFLWGGDLPDFPDPSLIVKTPAEVAGNYAYVQAGFGGELPPAGSPLVSQVVLVDDTIGITSNACEPIINADSLIGKIAMVDRGDCQFGVKCLAAEQAGAIAVIVCNNVDDAIFNMGPGTDGDQVTIPAIMISLEDCNTIKLGLPTLEVELSQQELEIPNPGPMGRAGDLDNGVIAHEYTHGVSTRLTGGPGQSGCLTNFEQAGEGWSDWFGLVMTTTPDMTPEQPRGIGTYAVGQPTTGDGIRTYPYSRDMNVDPHTYADINNESVPHGVGSVWCVMIWDLYWNLVDEYGYDEDLYYGEGGNNIAMQLVVDGLKLQPCNPNFLQSRDAILEADMVNYDGANQCLIWETFARRGLGASAEPDGEEAFDLPDDCNFTYRVGKTGVAEAEAGDTLTYTLNITNGRLDTIFDGIVTDQLPEGTTLVAGSSDCAVTEENGTLTFDVGTLATGESVSCTYQLKLSEDLFSVISFEDDLEEGDQNWTIESTVGPAAWTTTMDNANSGELSFFAEDVDVQSDQRLTFVAPVSLTGNNPALSFWHLYNTEADWDGGVVEISTDGTTWIDLGIDMIQNGYPGAVNNNPDSPISGRPAFNGRSDGWIQTVVDLTNYAGDDVLIRFRLACDAAVGGEGWYVDDIKLYSNFHSITNRACTDYEGEVLCNEVTTIVLGDMSTAVNEVIENERLAIYPNPTTGTVTLMLDASIAQDVQIRLFTADGRLLSQQKYDAFQSTELELGQYGAGIYMVQVQTESGVITRRVIVR